MKNVRKIGFVNKNVKHKSFLRWKLLIFGNVAEFGHTAQVFCNVTEFGHTTQVFGNVAE